MERWQMDFQTAVRTCFGKFASIQGRAARAEYWYFFLFYLIAIFAAGVLDAVLFRHGTNGPLSTRPAVTAATCSFARRLRHLRR